MASLLTPHVGKGRDSMSWTSPTGTLSDSIGTRLCHRRQERGSEAALARCTNGESPAGGVSGHICSSWSPRKGKTERFTLVHIGACLDEGLRGAPR
eukprot:scaffold152505_cov33-Tisochrysis_lutea.AAC.3